MDLSLHSWNLTKKSYDLINEDIIQSASFIIRNGCNSVENKILFNVYLPKLQLSGVNLEKADLSSSDLKEINLQSANLSGVNLTKTNLESANLKNANIGVTNIDIDEDHRGWGYSTTSLIETNFKNTNLEFTTFRSVGLHNNNFENTNFGDTVFLMFHFTMVVEWTSMTLLKNLKLVRIKNLIYGSYLIEVFISFILRN
jgi:uncharacterized protein YjbI with pentapeptide repeats